MSLVTERAEIDDDYIFVARLDCVKPLLMVLKAIHFKESAVVFATDKGLKITVEDSKSVQVSAFIQAEVFEEYTLIAEQAVFKLSLSVLIECLNIFGSPNTALKMSYQGFGYPLTLMLEENGVITDCNIKTQDPEEMLDFDFDSSNVSNKVIFKAESLKEIFYELDSTSRQVEIMLSPDPPYFRITTEGVTGETKVDIPKESAIIEVFKCTSVASSRYKYIHLKSSFKPLAVSQKASIRIDEKGLLCIQYMVPADKYTCYIEYFCIPLVTMQNE